MPKQQARGNISNYTVTMELRNGSVSTINGSVYTSVETCAQCELYALTGESSNVVSHAQQSYLPCAQEQSCFHSCRLSIPVKEVKAIRVTANTAVGKSSPALVALPRAGKSLRMEQYEKSLMHFFNLKPGSNQSYLANVQHFFCQLKPSQLTQVNPQSWQFRLDLGHIPGEIHNNSHKGWRWCARGFTGHFQWTLTLNVYVSYWETPVLLTSSVTAFTHRKKVWRSHVETLML